MDLPCDLPVTERECVRQKIPPPIKRVLGNAISVQSTSCILHLELALLSIKSGPKQSLLIKAHLLKHCHSSNNPPPRHTHSSKIANVDRREVLSFSVLLRNSTMENIR